jgi:hypothetical protein
MYKTLFPVDRDGLSVPAYHLGWRLVALQSQPSVSSSATSTRVWVFGQESSLLQAGVKMDSRDIDA